MTQQKKRVKKKQQIPKQNRRQQSQKRQTQQNYPKEFTPKKAADTKRNQKPIKIKKYRKPLNINIGICIFGFILIYVVWYIIVYFNTGHIRHYEVQKGSLSTNNIYQGIALRDELVVNTNAAGYVNYYAREGERVAKGDLVYTMDQTGRLKEYLANLNVGENKLSTRELAEFRSELVNFMHEFNPVNFDVTYDFKYSLKGTVLKLANTNMVESIHNMNNSEGLTDMVDFCRAEETGIVSYWTDGYENLTADMVTAEILDEKTYVDKKNQLIVTDVVESGVPAYKLSKNENWSIVIPVEEEMGVKLEEEKYVKVRFLKNQYESWGETKLLHNADGNTYIQLTFTNSMITFVSDRFLDIELLLENETGLKIPLSSIAEREFFLVPQAYITQGGNHNADGVIRQRYLEDGTVSNEFLETSIYSLDETEGEYYLDTSDLEMGDTLVLPGGEETYTVSKKSTLIGVYNMNKGYADFSQIKILSQNEEYAIVESNTRYGLRVYDNIVLDAGSVKANQFLYE